MRGHSVECPHCKLETILFVPPTPPRFFLVDKDIQKGLIDRETIQEMIDNGQLSNDALVCSEDGSTDWTSVGKIFVMKPNKEIFQSSPESEALSIPLAHINSGIKLEIRTLSGNSHQIKAIRLYDEIHLSEISAKRAEALKRLQGVSTGIGSIGSIGWVLATSVVIGAVESVLSAGATSSGYALLANVIKLEQELRANGTFISIEEIENIETPNPGLWRVPYKRKANVEAGVTFMGEKKWEMRELSTAFIHSGDEFITVQTEDGAVQAIRWTAVEHYACKSDACV